MTPPPPACHRLALLVLLLGAGLLLGPTRQRSSASDPASSSDRTTAFSKVPDGWTVELVAGPPLVEHPMMACFDERGRLFVAESAGLNRKADELLKNPPSKILLLEDTDGNGHFDRSTVFADRMTFPMGVLWHSGALYVASPPSLWRLRDTTGKGVANQREELVTRFGFTGNAADIHGPFLGPDGRLYWTDGRHGHEIRRPDGSLLKGLAASIFRCRPDGGDVEVVCGGGMDDPVEIAFTDEGEPLATVDILHGKPQRVDAIIHCVEGGVFPYHEAYREFKQTGELLPAAVDLGWVAPAGLMCYRTERGAGDLSSNLFSAQFNRHRIQRHILERDGASFRGSSSDWLVSDDPDFHPTDVLEDADGSLLVVDTGGWFSIGCPTSRVAKPEVKGAIYRLRPKRASPVEDPRGLTLKWDQLSAHELAGLLDDERFAVRDRAIERLAVLSSQALDEVKQVLDTACSVRAQRNALWTLTRMDTAEAEAAIRTCLAATDMSVRLAAVHATGLHRDTQALPLLVKLVVSDPSPPVRREAATALGRIGRPAAVTALFDGLRSGGDRFLEHSLVFALIQIADRDSTRKGLHDPSPLVRRAALIALDQMNGGDLTREEVAPLLSSSDPALQQTAFAIVTGRPGWAREMVGLLDTWLSQEKLEEARQESLRGALLAFCKDQAVQDVVTHALQRDSTSLSTRLLLLETIGRAPLEKLPAGWVEELGRALGDRDERVRRQALAAVRSTRVATFDDALLRLAADTTRPADMRVAALAALAPRLPKLDADAFAFLLGRLERTVPPLERLAAAQVLGRVHLEENQLAQLTGSLAVAGGLELPHLLAPYEHGQSEAVGKALLKALERSPGLTSLAPDTLSRVLQDYPAAVREAAGPLLQHLGTDSERQKARLGELEPLLAGGDRGRGRTVFFGKKASCAACHAVRGEGGGLGPDLSTIGAVRSGRDLLESIVFPSASFARGFEPYTVVTRDGRLHTGILNRETGEAVYLVTAERAEVRLPRADIESIEPGRVSIMPQGLEAQLNRQELGDLLAFLQALR